MEHEDADVIGVSELDPEKTEDIEKFVLTLEDVHDKLDEGRPLQSAEEEFSELASYEGSFDGNIGESIDEIAELSSYVQNYLEEYDSDASESIAMEEVMAPLQEHGADIEYNGNEEAQVKGDPGLKLVTNTMGLNGKWHGKEDDNYQMWAEVEEEEGEYRIDFWDNGPGLSEDHDYEQIFEKGVGENSGKGLYLAREILEQFGGSIRGDKELEEEKGGFALEITISKAYGA